MSTPADIEFARVTKAYDATIAVDGISLKIPAGTYCCLLGPSGCGKTTTLRMVAGHEEVTDGDIVLGAQVINDLPPARRGTAMMFQSYALFPHLSVADNVAFSLRMKGVEKAERRNRALDLLGMVDMADYADRLPSQLSGGQQQRVALARALITDPSVLLLDEPLSALDPFLRVRVRAELKRLQRELGITFVHVTHSQAEAMALADLIVVMNNGRIEQAGSARDVFNKPQTEFVARFIGGHNVLAGPDGPITIRSDQVRVASSSDAINPENGLAAVVGEIEYQGTHVSIALTSDRSGPLTALMTERQFFDIALSPGDPVHVTWRADDVHRLAATNL